MTNATQIDEREDIYVSIKDFERVGAKFLFVSDFTKEKDKALWRKGYIYCNANVNDLFRAFRFGIACGKAEARN